MTANDVKRSSVYDQEDKASYDGRSAGIMMCIISVIMAIILIPAMGAIVDAHENADKATVSYETEIENGVDVMAGEGISEKNTTHIGFAKFVENYKNIAMNNAEFVAQDTVTFDQDK